ncbi:Na+/H+ antiporter NhaA [Nocardioides sp. NPDC057772]|uniref:Na+/H+ antiporter NhaA n=1 Tax=Nocardioides sp. NPDC057772 TaxID=3346245 RepID=UPI00366D9B4E
MTDTRNRLFTRGSWLETSRTAEILRAETTGGILLIIAAVIAVILANSPLQEAYEAVRDYRIGPHALHLDLTIGAWAADGLLAIFFFVAGLELKREFVSGDLRDPRRAALPIAAAVGGMVVPALVYVVVNLIGGGSLAGWATPVATDIAFAVAILAVISTHLPAGLRTFLLTLAVVDDLLGIIVIAVFFTSELHIGFLLLAFVPIGLFALLVQRRIRSPWLLLPLAAIAWALVHASGVHATVAGVLLGFTVPVIARNPEAKRGLAEHFEHLVRPISAGVAVPIFAFFAAGVSLGGWSGITGALRDPITLGIILGLVVGKTVGISGSTWLLARFTRASLDDDLAWTDVIGMAMLAGIGFTVSLLIGELAFRSDPSAHDHMKVGVLFGSVLAALLATIVLRARNRVYRRIGELEAIDANKDGVPDVFEDDQGRDR